MPPKSKVKARKLDPRKTREPVEGHPTPRLPPPPSPPPPAESDSVESNTSVITTILTDMDINSDAPPLPLPPQPTLATRVASPPPPATFKEALALRRTHQPATEDLRRELTVIVHAAIGEGFNEQRAVAHGVASLAQKYGGGIMNIINKLTYGIVNDSDAPPLPPPPEPDLDLDREGDISDSDSDIPPPWADTVATIRELMVPLQDALVTLKDEYAWDQWDQIEVGEVYAGIWQRFSDLSRALRKAGISPGTRKRRGYYYPPPKPTADRSTETQAPPPSPVCHYTEAAVQTSPPPTAIPPALPLLPPPPPARTYAEAAVQASGRPQPPGCRSILPPASPPQQARRQPPPPPAPGPPPRSQPPLSSPQPAMRAVVLHAAPTNRKPGEMRRWLEEDNKGVQIAGIRWLLQEGRRLGKAASSLVIYLATPLSPGKLRMGRKCFRTTSYDWDLPVKEDKGKGRAL